MWKFTRFSKNALQPAFLLRGFDGRNSGFCTGSSVLKPERLRGKVAIITGGASGIGQATAELFAAEGAKVVIADIQDELGHQVAKSVGAHVDYLHCDVTKESDISAAVDFAMSKHGSLDIMFNNAATGSSIHSILQVDTRDFDKLMSVNLRGAVLGTKHAARVMIPAKRGNIICTLGVAALVAGEAPHAYTISKCAVNGLVRSAANELKQHGIRVNGVSPYLVPTPLAVGSFKVAMPDLKEEELIAMISRKSGFYGAKFGAIDMARAAMFLASEEARYISGHNLVVDGAYSISKAFTPFGETPPPFSASSSSS